MQRSNSGLATLFGLVLLGSGCTGSIVEGSGGGASGTAGGRGRETPGRGVGTAGPGGASNPVETGTGTAASCTGPSPAALRRLNRNEYDNTLRDLLGDAKRPARSFLPDEQELGFTNNADALVVSGAVVEQYNTAAERLAADAKARLAEILPCDPAQLGEAQCAEKFVATFGRRAFRRPLSTDEIAGYVALYEEGRTSGAFADGIELVVQALLQSPNFLYRSELPLVDADATSIGSYALATRLSYFIWGSMPDDELLDAAEKGQLRTQAQIEAAVRRMLGDAKAKQSVALFHREWLEIEHVVSLEKDATRYPSWGKPLQESLLHEAETFLERTFWESSSGKDLFTASHSYMDGALAAHYGLSSAATGKELTKVEHVAGQRAGILTLGAILANTTTPVQTSPVFRGKFVRERLLCQHLPPPPNDVEIETPPPSDETSTRKRFEEHAKNEACAGCHKLMDPVGLGLEHYDPVGRYRTMDGPEAVDASGELVAAGDADGPFNGAVELAQKLEAGTEARLCLVKNWFRYAFGRGERDEDQCLLNAMLTAAASPTAGVDLQKLVISIATSEAFSRQLPTE